MLFLHMHAGGPPPNILPSSILTQRCLPVYNGGPLALGLYREHLHLEHDWSTPQTKGSAKLLVLHLGRMQMAPCQLHVPG